MRVAWNPGMIILTSGFPNCCMRSGRSNLISVNVINYEHFDVGIQKIVTDYEVLIVFQSLGR